MTRTLMEMSILGLPKKQYRIYRRKSWWLRHFPFLPIRLESGLVMQAGTMATFSAHVKVNGSEWKYICQNTSVLEGLRTYGLRVTDDEKFFQVYIDRVCLVANP